MNNYYTKTQRTSIFTGIGWTKQFIQFALSTHIDEWHHRCESNSNPNQISFQNTFTSLEKKSLLITIEFFYSRADILPTDQKNWFNSSIEEYKQYPVKRLKQWIANAKKLFKINQNNPTYGSNKIMDYFSKIRETTEENSNISNKSSEIFPLPNNSLADNPVDNNIQKNNVDYSQK